MRRGFSMPDLNTELVTDRQIYYINRPGALRQIFTRSQRYLYYIVEELERRGMPTELALLPMVESAFNPMALSSAQASGLWQFIPSTGKSYKLEQNWWVDERRDVIASTNAALDYLQTIYEMHGDWHLALASYNWGEGAVGRAVARNRAAGLSAEYQHLNMPGRDALLRAQAAGAQEHRRAARALRPHSSPHSQPAVFRHRREPGGARSGDGSPAVGDLGGRDPGPQSGLQASRCCPPTAARCRW
jgi:hypothetical protein